jgi:hypothetical protein
VGRLPTFLVIGAQKSGTTSLIHHLAGHPDVLAVTEEVHFFDRHYSRGIDWYRDRFEGAENARAVGESTPDYMYVRDVPRRMAEYVPGARLIAILRDPVARAYSHYWHARTRGWERNSLAEALAAEGPRMAEARDERARGRFAYVDRGRYLRQLQHVCEHFPREALHVLLFEDLRDRPTEAVRSVYRFVGVDDSVAPPDIGRVRNRFVTFRSMRLRKPIRSLPRPLRRVAARLNIRYVRYPPMPTEARERLRAEFAEGNRELASWLGRDLSAWERNPPS